jgi:hypothetical protein
MDPRVDSAAVPQGSAGLAGDARPAQVEAAGAAYGAALEQTRVDALAKRDEDSAAMLATTRLGDAAGPSGATDH